GEMEARRRVGVLDAQAVLAVALDEIEARRAEGDRRRLVVGVVEELGVRLLRAVDGRLRLRVERDRGLAARERDDAEMRRSRGDHDVVVRRRADLVRALLEPRQANEAQPARGCGQTLDALRAPGLDLLLVARHSVDAGADGSHPGDDDRAQQHSGNLQHYPLLYSYKIYRPRRNMRSSSAIGSCTQVGRPWLHWPERSVASISRRSAFISGKVKRRFARTEP